MEMNKLLQEIGDNTEWLSTTEGDEIECISIENLKSILSRFFKKDDKKDDKNDYHIDYKRQTTLF